MKMITLPEWNEDNKRNLKRVGHASLLLLSFATAFTILIPLSDGCSRNWLEDTTPYLFDGGSSALLMAAAFLLMLPSTIYAMQGKPEADKDDTADKTTTEYQAKHLYSSIGGNVEKCLIATYAVSAVLIAAWGIWAIISGTNSKNPIALTIQSVAVVGGLYFGRDQGRKLLPEKSKASAKNSPLLAMVD